MKNILTKTISEQVYNTFTKTHDEYCHDWNEAMASGDTTLLEKRLADDYYVVFMQGNNDKPLIFDRADAIKGMRASIDELPGSVKVFENRIIRERDDERYVVFYELLIQKDKQTLARMFTIEDWDLVHNEWKIVRETVEMI